jgi:uncharacterized membrane protein (Fun14 family)
LGEGFLLDTILGYTIKKVLKFIAVIAGLFIATLAYLEYQRVITIDWTKLQAIWEQTTTTVENTITQLSNNIGAAHTAPATTKSWNSIEQCVSWVYAGTGTQLNLQKLFRSTRF